VTELLSFTHEDITKRQHLKEMKGELSKLNMVSEFAQYARLERRINVLTEDIKSKCMYALWLFTYMNCESSIPVFYYINAFDDELGLQEKFWSLSCNVCVQYHVFVINGLYVY